MWRYAKLLKKKVNDGRYHVHRPGKRARLMNVDININSHGFRDREFSIEKPKTAFRILALGDSLTFGWGVPVQDVYVKLIEKSLNEDVAFQRSVKGPIEVINMGVGNYNTSQETEAYQKVGRYYKPNAVIVFFYINDAEPVQTMSPHFLMRNSYLFAFVLQRFEQLRPFWEEDQNFINYYHTLYEGSKLKLFEEAMAQLISTIRKDDIKLIGVVLPELRLLENYPFTSYHQAISSYLGKEGVPVIDLLPVFSGKRSRSFFVAKDDPHPNRLAHQMIADRVTQFIKEERILP